LTGAAEQLFGPSFLLERPLLKAVQAGDSCVLLIDEVDRADDEFEAFLLELLGDFQVTIPEVGTIAAKSRPIVILTSNRTRELHDALKRRCLYTWIGFPPAEREVEIVRTRLPGIGQRLATQVVAAVNQLRDMDLEKAPGVAESIDWAQSLDALGADQVTAEAALDTLGAVVKDRDDVELATRNIQDVIR
jgi:MoxR-like ATPase